MARCCGTNTLKLEIHIGRRNTCPQSVGWHSLFSSLASPHIFVTGAPPSQTRRWSMRPPSITNKGHLLNKGTVAPCFERMTFIYLFLKDHNTEKLGMDKPQQMLHTLVCPHIEVWLPTCTSWKKRICKNNQIRLHLCFIPLSCSLQPWNPDPEWQNTCEWAPITALAQYIRRKVISCLTPI